MGGYGSRLSPGRRVETVARAFTSPAGGRGRRGPIPFMNGCAQNRISLGGSSCFYLSSPVAKNIRLRDLRKSPSYPPLSCPERGALAIVTNVGTGCGGRGGAFDERRQGGRRSRVVLTPRRWRQASRKYPRGDGDKKARSPGRARRKPLKPLRAGMPGDFRCDRCEHSCAF